MRDIKKMTLEKTEEILAKGRSIKMIKKIFDAARYQVFGQENANGNITNNRNKVACIKRQFYRNLVSVHYTQAKFCAWEYQPQQQRK